MLIEMHCHTSEYSLCSNVSAVDLVRQVLGKNIQGIVFTDHHYLWDEQELKVVKHKAEVPDHFLILSGQEVSTRDSGDVLVYGASTVLAKGLSLTEVREQCPEAAIVWAHPYRKGKRPDDGELLNGILDGIEIFNANHTVRENSRALQDWHRLRFTAIGGTDTHGESYAGLYPTLFDHAVRSVGELAAEIRHGRCRPFLKEIPRAGANTQVTEVTIGTKGQDEVRERIIIKEIADCHKWQSAERAYRIMDVIVRSGFDGGTFRVPRPIDEEPGSMTLIEQGVRGKSLFDKLMSSDLNDGRDYLMLAAKWLARLHNCRLRVTPPEEFGSKEGKRLDRYLRRFVDVGHRQTRKAREILEAVRLGEERLLLDSGPLMVQGHGDYHPKNVLVGQDNLDNRATLYVAAIDFESSYVLPRAFDVGCFVAQFRNQFYPYPEMIQRYPEEVFLDAYLAQAEGLESDFLRNVELFRARTNMSIAAYLIKVGMGESEDLWRVLVEAEQALTHL